MELYRKKLGEWYIQEVDEKHTGYQKGSNFIKANPNASDAEKMAFFYDLYNVFSPLIS